MRESDRFNSDCEQPLAVRDEELRHLRETIDAFLPLDLDTGLLNRNGLVDAIRRCLLWWERRREHFAVLAVELPEIHNVHPTDRPPLIRHLGAMIAAALRQVDEAGRIDDATYVVVLRDFHKEGISSIADRVRTSISATADYPPEFTPTAQLGICLVGSGARLAPSAYLEAAVEAARRATTEPVLVQG